MKPVPFACEVDITKAAEEEGRWIVEGFAATSDFDLQEDIITPEALQGSSGDLIENSTVLLNHDTDQAIGKVLASESREGGLFLKILVSRTVPEVWQRIQEGVLNKFSVRGRILEARKQWLSDLQRFARMILKMHLLEVSLVSVPANPKAKAIGWYVEKALADYEAGGGAIEEVRPADPKGGVVMEKGEKSGVGDEVLLIEASGKPQAGAAEGGKGGAAPASPAPELRKDAAPGSAVPGILDRLKALGAGIQEILQAQAAGAGQPPASVPAGLEKKVSDLEAVVKRISGALSLSAGPEEGRSQGGAPSIPELTAKVDGLVKRLEVLEKQPGQRSSLEGQEPLPGDEGKKGSLWKGVV